MTEPQTTKPGDDASAQDHAAGMPEQISTAAADHQPQAEQEPAPEATQPSREAKDEETAPACLPQPRLLRRLASLAGDIFSPLLMPTYVMIVALWLTPMNRLPLAVRAWSSLGVFFLTAVVPAFSIWMLLRLKRISDVSISDHRQRPLPFLIATVCYILAAVYLGALNAPRWMICFFIAATLVVVAELIISLYWKISAHAAGAAGLLGFVAWLAARHALLGDPLVMVSAAILILGIVAWARLLLCHHNMAQVCAGAALGFLTVFLMLLY